jgi:hypothetical protein
MIKKGWIEKLPEADDRKELPNNWREFLLFYKFLRCIL